MSVGNIQGQGNLSLFGPHQTNVFNITINNNFGNQTNISFDSSSGLQALSILDSLFSGGSPGLFGSAATSALTIANLPSPNPTFSGAPAGRGLSVGDDGTVTTAGGYEIKATGRGATLQVFSPEGELIGQISGDPHVYGSDGEGGLEHEFDFTEDSNMILPDGTLIHLDTTSQTGRSLLQNVTIVNGADRVEISGINTRNPTTGEVSYDGYEWRTDHLSANGDMDTFRMGGTEADTEYWLEQGNTSLGHIGGSHYDGEKYVVEAGGESYWVDASLKPELGSAAWGHELRSTVLDLIANTDMPESFKDFAALWTHLDHMVGEFGGAQSSSFGGQANWFADFNVAHNAIQGLAQAVIDFAVLTHSLGTGQLSSTLN